MRVVIDASFLVLPPSGTATYVRSIAQALSEIAPELDLRLIQPAWEQDRSLRALSRASLRFWPWQQRLRRASWDIYGVWRRAARGNVQISFIYRILPPPVRAGCPLVVTIHDVIPLALPEYRGVAVDARPHRRDAPDRARRAPDPHAVARCKRRHCADAWTPFPAHSRDSRKLPGLNSGQQRTGRPVHDTIAKFGIRGRYIFNAGGFDTRKNLPVLLEAFGRALPRLQEPAQLVIAGAPHTANPRVFPPVQPGH
ncbi:MAG: hypothetical protein KatS3mg059_1707 [Thermomicrobiales bacterium]|nr:MAG: hypothetical protein KatS3mg059_1707 [Thermomicrobiales bacterium]